MTDTNCFDTIKSEFEAKCKSFISSAGRDPLSKLGAYMKSILHTNQQI